MAGQPILVAAPGAASPRWDDHASGQHGAALDVSVFHASRYVDDDDPDRRLARLVAAGDTDIRVHLERVNRRVEAGDPDGTYGALVDLFIATGPGTSGVRSRALLAAGDLLDEIRVDALHSGVTAGLEPGSPMPAALQSVLSLGVTGQVELVARNEGTGPAHAEPSELRWGARLTGPREVAS
jgi:hypothetical protein